MASSSADPFEGFLKPSKDEETYYFSGLAGSPRLITKTSTTPWETHTDTASVAKRISTVGDHHLVHKWCPELRTGIVRALSEPGLEWDCFYPIRIGSDANPAKHPVVLLVCLLAPSQGPQPWEPAMLAALRCRALLREYDVHDVEVEMKQSEFVPMATSASATLASYIDWAYSQPLPIAGTRDLDMAEINGNVMTLLPFPGCRIEQEKGRNDESKAAAGTMGLYLRLAHTDQSASPGAIYGLTSRHVTVGKRVVVNQDLRSPSSRIIHDNDPSLRMLTSGPSCVYNASTGLHSAGRLMKALLRDSQLLSSNNPDDPHKSELCDMHRASIGYVEELQDALKQVEAADTTQRTLGTVAYSPGHGIDNHGNFKDWALVQMADADRRGLSNNVYMAGHTTYTMFREEAAAVMEPSQLSSFALNLDADGFLQLHGRDMPPQPPFAGVDRTSHLVAKRGQTTSLRYGITNEIEAVRRTPFGDEEPLVSLHLLVVDFVGGHFSQPGDSGSSVFDCSGRVIGIVDGGEKVPDVSSQQILPERLTQLTASVILDSGNANPGENPSPDVTFVSPIQWILDDMREFTGYEPEIM
ncbi:hypothetical protein F503_07551 [Ophiostoma piceae UAMH 11346]|uniref:Uncharacterized protein n=1 Tax=Ophiostoma piceae (strain UAMH 11346) TaxID=1262450 RepID=S3D8K1_OPHP1|nr:hypothetical protein F503_07551 [Ophiostoma piceae UAMH 11346]